MEYEDDEFWNTDEETGKVWYRNEEDDQVWWLDNSKEMIGVHVFSFDRKEEFNLFRDYPYKLTQNKRKYMIEKIRFGSNSLRIGRNNMH